MAFNIANFSSKINEHGVAKNNLFFATITTPTGIAGAMEENKIVQSGDLKFFCRSVTLPEFDISTTDYQPNGFGSPIRRPQGMNFPILPAVFMVDSNFGVMKFFHRWAQSIVQYDRSAGNNGNVGGALPFEMGYKSGANGLLSWFSTINTVAQAIRGIKRPRNIQDAINEITNISTIVNSFK